jgi:hypothetical protein
MAKRSIEETFKTIKPKGQGGQNAAAISVGVASNNTDLSTSLSQAGQQIAQLQSAYQAQASLIAANTQAVQGNTSAQSGKSAGSVAGGIASSLFGGLGLLSPLISGIASLFGGNSTPAPLPVYRAPSPVAINTTLNSATPGSAASGTAMPNFAPAQNGGSPLQPAATSLPALAANILAAPPAGGFASSAPTATSAQNWGPPPQAPAASVQAPAAPQAAPAPAAPQIIVNVTAMDSQSFMDHSTDIANAVREAMLNMHPINGVVATL